MADEGAISINTGKDNPPAKTLGEGTIGLPLLLRTLLTADQHRRLAAILRKATTPGHEEQALQHERSADLIDRQQQEMRAVTRGASTQ